MWATHIILNFLVAMFKDSNKRAGEINFNDILYLSQYIQNVNHQYVINIKFLRRYFTFFFSYNVFEIWYVLCIYSMSWFTLATFQVRDNHVGSIQVLRVNWILYILESDLKPGDSLPEFVYVQNVRPNHGHTERNWETGHQEILFVNQWNSLSKILEHLPCVTLL